MLAHLFQGVLTSQTMAFYVVRALEFLGHIGIERYAFNPKAH